MDLAHVVVLMLENRSFDSMLGKLRDTASEFDGLTGNESNVWHRADGGQPVSVWNDPGMTPATATIPDPDPGEKFTDIAVQLHGLHQDAPMGGFVDNYMRQPPAHAAYDPRAVMHYFAPGQVPVLSELATAFGVSDHWFASAPCQTWPNRFFAHCGTAGGWVNNAPARFPYEMPTVFNLLEAAGQNWRVYFQDIPQAAALSRLWPDAERHFRRFNSFADDAAKGALPAYSFVEPRYFTDVLLGTIPDDQHPPHAIGYGEQLIASVYNAVRGGPHWRQTLLLITYDEHGGCYDHVVPPAATPPGGPYPDGFAFDRFGARVPAVIVSPHMQAARIIRPSGPVPFDHTSIIATLRRRFSLGSLTARDAAAPELISSLEDSVLNDGPESVAAPKPSAPAVAVAASRARPPNDLQASLAVAAAHLPTKSADLGTHRRRVAAAPVPVHAELAATAESVTAHVKAFLGEL
jgi:phospholipase C